MLSNLPESYHRSHGQLLVERLREPRRRIQILAGPRQVGKTTLALQALETLRNSGLEETYATADDVRGQDQAWIETQWELGRLLARKSKEGAVLVLDEVQKVSGWSETIKRLWDEDTTTGEQLRVVLLGSAPLLVQKGLTESLAGRFELIRIPHWSYREMRDAFGWDIDTYIYFGGYAGAIDLIGDRSRWANFVLDSLVETTLSRDILLLTRVDKPALLRQLFRLGTDYSGQIVSYQKMLGQLQDVGNTTTLAHYLGLLSGCGLVTGLQKFSGSHVRQRGSIPKLMVLNTALMTAGSIYNFDDARNNGEFWGRLVESAVGSHLLNTFDGTGIDVLYWRERNREVDFVLTNGMQRVAIEVGSGRKKDVLPGLSLFTQEFSPARQLLVGGSGISIEEFLLTSAEDMEDMLSGVRRLNLQR